jgi:hypothetical protein
VTVVLALVAGLLVGASPAEAAMVFVPSGDAYVERDQPGTNYGASPRLRASSAPERQTLLKFRVEGVGTARVLSAKLRLYSQKDAPSGGDLFGAADSSWTEKGVTWTKVPPTTTPLIASLGPVATGSWHEVELGSYITGDGAWTVKITSPSNTGALYASKEVVGFEPQLVITVGDDGPPTPPTGLSAAVVGGTYVALAWNPSTDDTAVSGYHVLRDDVQVASTTAPFFADIGAPGGAHRYRIVAFDPTLTPSAPSAETTATAPAAPTSPFVVPIDPRIPADCSTDVTVPLNDFLTGVPDGAPGAPNTVLFGAGRCYLADGTLHLALHAHQIVDGNGSTFRTSRRGPIDDNGFSHRQHFRITSMRDLEVRNLTVAGTNTVSDVLNHPELGASLDSYGNEHGVDIRLSDGVDVHDVRIDGVWGSGVAVDRSSNIAIRAVTVDRAGTNGALVLDAHNLVFEGVSLLHPRRHGWKIEPEAGESTSGIEIRNSTVCAFTYAFFSSGVKGMANDVNVHDNVVTCAKAVAFLVRAESPANRSNWRFTNNVVQKTGTVSNDVFHFEVVDDIVVNDNVVATPRHAIGVSFADAHGTLEVKRNTFTRADHVYKIDGEIEGPGVDACCNTTGRGENQP